MKSISTNPWALIRWAAVSLIFAGALAIGIDQIRARDGEIARLKLAVQTQQVLRESAEVNVRASKALASADASLSVMHRKGAVLADLGALSDRLEAIKTRTPQSAEELSHEAAELTDVISKINEAKARLQQSN